MGRVAGALVAQLLELETRLSDAAVGMFVRLILGLFRVLLLEGT
jgi:hypothetical protein